MFLHYTQGVQLFKGGIYLTEGAKVSSNMSGNSHAIRELMFPYPSQLIETCPEL